MNPPPNHSILLVEDEEHLAFALEFNLQAEGYSVSVAPNLKTARTMLSPLLNLILLDVMLPDGSGVEFCDELRSQGNRTPLIMLTAKSRPEDIVAGLQAGADDYVTKPFNLKELLTRIQAQIRRSTWDETPQPTAVLDDVDDLSFGDNTVHFHTHQATLYNGKCVDLTELEVRLMRFFSQHTDRVVSRQDLLEKVWHVAPNTNTRAVDNFIVRMRRLFETDPSNPVHFLTVRGVGYRFIQTI